MARKRNLTPEQREALVRAVRGIKDDVGELRRLLEHLQARLQSAPRHS